MANQSNAFNNPEFQSILKKYEELQHGIRDSLYLDADEILDLSDYYATVENDVKASSEVLDYGLALHPDNHEILKFLIQDLLMQNKNQRAHELIQQFAQDDNDPEVKLIRSALLFHEKKRKDGLELIKEILDETTGTSMEKNALEEVGHLLMNIKEYHLAKQILKKGFDKYPDNQQILSLYTETCLYDDDFEQCIILYDKILDNDPYDLEAWINQANCYMEIGNDEKAAEAIDFASAIDDDNISIYMTKGSYYFNQGMSEEAYKCFRKALDLEPDNLLALEFVIASLVIQNKHQEIINLILEKIPRIVSRNQKYYSIYLHAAVSYHELNQDEEALYYLNQIMEINPKDPNGLLMYGIILVHQGRPDEAQKKFDEAADYALNIDAVFLESGRNYLKCHYYQEAIEQLMKVHINADDYELVLNYLAKCYKQMGMKPQFLSIVRQVSERFPDKIADLFGDDIPEGMDPKFFYEYIKQNNNLLWNQ